MALVKGTNCGFVAARPTADPDAGATITCDNYCRAVKMTAPSNAFISEMGCYISNATEAANLRLAIYSHDSENNLPDALLAVSSSTAKGTTEGWKIATGFSFEVTQDTIYWLAIELENTATSTVIDRENSGVGDLITVNDTATTFQNPWTNDNTDVCVIAIYALLEANTSIGGELYVY